MRPASRSTPSSSLSCKGMSHFQFQHPTPFYGKFRVLFKCAVSCDWHRAVVVLLLNRKAILCTLHLLYFFYIFVVNKIK